MDRGREKRLMTTRLSSYATPTLLESSSQVSALPPAVRPLFRPLQVVGPAYPVHSQAGDNLAVHLALAEVPPGHILVVETGGAVEYGFWGEIMTEAAIARDVAGLVTDGAVRDTREIRQLHFPVFCAGVAISGTIKQSPGEVNQPVVMGNCRIRPGDIVVGDDDGVVVVPAEAQSEVIERAQARVAKENSLIQRLRDGELTVDLLGLRRDREEEK